MFILRFWIGIPDLLEGYRLFREKLSKIDAPPAEEDTPLLIICGHGSVDDPDGQPIFEEIYETLSKEEFAFIKNDVSVVRVRECRCLPYASRRSWI